MADSTTPAPNSTQKVLADMHAHVAAISKHHLTLSLGVIGVLVVVLIVGGVFGIHALHSLDAAMAAASQQTAVANQQASAYRDQYKQTQQQIDSDHNAILALTAGQAQAQKTIVIRDNAATAKSAEVSQVDRAPDQVAKDASEFLGTVPKIEPDSLFGFDKPAVQAFVKTKIEHDQFAADLKDVQTQYGQEQTKSTLLQKDLDNETKLRTSSDALAAQWKKSADDWEKAAKKTKLRRFLEGAERGGELLGVGYLAYQAGKASH